MCVRKGMQRFSWITKSSTIVYRVIKDLDGDLLMQTNVTEVNGVVATTIEMQQLHNSPVIKEGIKLPKSEDE